MFDVPKTSDPSKWDKDISATKSDFMTNNVGGEDLNEWAREMGVKPKFNFHDGKAINLETGEEIDMFGGDKK